MTAIYTLCMIALIYMSYIAGIVRQNAMLVLLYLAGAFVIGLLAFTSACEWAKRRESYKLDKNWRKFISSASDVAKNNKEEKENETITDR